MIVLVTGSRYWHNKELIKKEIMKLNPTKIIQGGARGADQLAKEVGIELFIEVVQVDANWNLYGRVAGPIRNEQMIEMKPDLVLAFHNDIESSKGTRNMINLANKYGVQVRLISE